MVSIGVAHGRFQPFHLDHLAYVLAAKRRCDHIIVGITNPDTSMTGLDNADPSRSEPLSNPFTYYERLLIIKESLIEASLSSAEFDVVPFPINVPELIPAYVPLDATFYLTIFDDWGLKKQQLLNDLGLKTEVLWQRASSDKNMTATEIRALIRENGDWEKLMPPAAAGVMKMLALDKRIQNIGTKPEYP